jgi:uracil-DNA glycosylase family 4
MENHRKERLGATMRDVPGRTDYDSFAEALRQSACTRCALAKERTTIVVDRGNAAGRIMLVGEGPGRDEDLQGRAFIGRAGKLLDRLMAAKGIDTEVDTLIANVVKCRPPGNRAPKKDEADACRPYLLRQIELVDPRLIILLGAAALGLFFPQHKKTPMRDLVGRTFKTPEHGDKTFAVLYHPAYLLRDPRKQPLFLEHLEAILKGFSPGR